MIKPSMHRIIAAAAIVPPVAEVNRQVLSEYGVSVCVCVSSKWSQPDEIFGGPVAKSVVSMTGVPPTEYRTAESQ